MYFKPANEFHIPSPIILPYGIQHELNDILPQLEPNIVNLFESYKLSSLHGLMHELLAQIVSSGIDIYFIDMANILDPHKLAELCENPIDCMSRIHLSRPFQMHQCISTINTLGKNNISPAFIIVSSITYQFLNAHDPIRGLVLPVRHILGVLQKLSLQGHTILVTAKYAENLDIKINNILMQMYSTIAKVYIRKIRKNGNEIIELVNHPSIPPISIHKKIDIKRNHTTELDLYF